MPNEVPECVGAEARRRRLVGSLGMMMWGVTSLLRGDGTLLVSYSTVMASLATGLSTPPGAPPPLFKKGSTTTVVRGISVHPVPLRSNKDKSEDFRSPYAFAASNVADLATVVAAHQTAGDTDDSQCTPQLTAASHINFLATQVWPSARSAAMALERHFSLVPENKKITVCEFGCGPGLPSLTAAVLGAPMVYATDLDPFALELVQTAAECQGVSDRVTTKVLDLVHGSTDEIPGADLYLFSDVFENNAVAQGAARVAAACLQTQATAVVWVFAQSDRAQRDIFLRELQRLLDDDPTTLYWQPMTLEEQAIQSHHRLWLCDIDETRVQYG